jgi:hypothetical protein
MSRCLVTFLFLALGAVLLHEGAMAITGHDVAFASGSDEPHHHHDAADSGHDAMGALPMPCEAVREVVPSLQRPVPDPQPVATPTAAITIVRDDPEGAAPSPGIQAEPAVRCRAVFQVYRI